MRRVTQNECAVFAALVLVAVTQVLMLRGSWFFLDDVVALAEARADGLTADYLGRSVARHFLPGHKLFDWLVAAPFGPSWTMATFLLSASMVGGCAYLAAAMSRIYGPSWRLAIPVALAGTAWAMIAGGQWFSAGAGVYPSFACLCGALYHHVRWRQDGSRAQAAAGVLLTALAVVFWVQAIVAPALLLGAALVAQITPGRAGLADVRREALAVAPHAAVVLSYAVYASTRPGFGAEGGLPALDDLMVLGRVVALRGLLPSLVGSGMPGAGETARQADLQMLAAVLLALAVAAAVLLRTRWLVASGWIVLGVVLCTVTIGGGRLDELGPSEAGTTPRYLMIGVLCAALGIGALLTPSARDARLRRHWAGRQRTVAIGVAVAAVSGLYLANLAATYRDAVVSRDRGTATKAYFSNLERAIDALNARERASLVSGVVPGHVYYPPPDPSSDLRRVMPFLGRDAPPLEGRPQPGGRLLAVSADGTLAPVRLRPVDTTARCDASCEVVHPPADPAQGLYVAVEFAGPAGASAALSVTSRGGTPLVAGAQRVRVPAGTTAMTVPVQATSGGRPLRVRVEATGVRPLGLALGPLEPDA